MVKAIILAAGMGTRLRPLTYGIPKPLLPVKGRPIIDWVIRNVLTCKEVDEIVIAIPGTTGENFHDRVLSHTHGICVDSYVRNLNYGCRIRTIPTPQKETAGDLRHVIDEMGISSGSIIVAYGDNLTGINLGEMADYHQRAADELGIAATVLLFSVPEKDVGRFGIAKVRKQGSFDLIERFVEKPETGNAPSNLANAGYYILDVGQIGNYLKKEKVKVEESLFPYLAGQEKLAGFVANLPFWIDIGTLEAYEEANKLVHDRLIIPPPVPENNAD
ncbi:MAG: nucleotidyltransferase family protein [Candidatus Aenigmarchaeota archaeon]|nr:nucleotidyltransferase family protein [Candidatus Aenigmarchaeota archaeon]